MDRIRDAARVMRERLASMTIDDRALVALLLAAMFKAYVWAALAAQVPDEHGYFAEIADIATKGTTVSYTGHIVGVWAYSGAAVHRIAQAIGVDPLFAVRMLGGICTVIVVWVAYRMGTLLSDGRFVPFGAAILVAFNPMYSFLGSSANSDTMQTMWATVALFAAVHVLAQGVTILGVAGAIVAYMLTYYTKTSRAVLVLGTLGAAGVAAALLQSKAAVSSMWKTAAAAVSREGMLWVAAVAAVGFAFRGRVSLLLQTPIRADIVPTPGTGGQVIGRSLPSASQTLGALKDSGHTVAEHFWGWFGLLHVPGSVGFYRVQTVIMAAALAGVVIALFRALYGTVWQGRPVEPPTDDAARRRLAGRAAAWAVLALTVAVTMYAIIDYSLTTGTMMQGRYLLTVIVPVYLLTAKGLSLLVPRRYEGPALGALLTVMLSVNVWALLYVVVPYFF